MELEEEGAPVSVTLIKPSAIDTPYREHAKNYMDVEPLNPPPVYAPETVAEAILHCAEHPERDMFVGGGGKALSVAGENAPRLTDKAMEATMFDLQQSDTPSQPGRADSLHAPSRDGEERGGYPGHVAESSVYTKAAMHPFVTGALVFAGAALGLKLLRRAKPAANGRARNAPLRAKSSIDRLFASLRLCVRNDSHAKAQRRKG